MKKKQQKKSNVDKEKGRVDPQEDNLSADLEMSDGSDGTIRQLRTAIENAKKDLPRGGSGEIGPATTKKLKWADSVEETTVYRSKTSL